MFCFVLYVGMYVINVCVYVLMYICTYVRMYVCIECNVMYCNVMYVCMYYVCNVCM